MTLAPLRLLRAGSFGATLALAGGFGCVSQSQITLTASVSNASLAKSSNAFGTVVKGSFDVDFDLGQYVGQPVTVTGLNLRLSRGGAAIATSAQFALDATSPTLPLTLSAGSNGALHYTITLQSPSASDLSALCAGAVTIDGSASQSATSAPIAIAGTAVAVSGC
jgi:hypothetical protein